MHQIKQYDRRASEQPDQLLARDNYLNTLGDYIFTNPEKMLLFFYHILVKVINSKALSVFHYFIDHLSSICL